MQDSSTLSVFFGASGGRMGRTVVVEVERECNSAFVAAGRFDQSPKDQIALAGACGVILLRWTGAAFERTGSYLSSSYCGQILDVDSNGDGHTDLVVADQGFLPDPPSSDPDRRGLSSAVQVLIGDGQGHFSLGDRAEIGKGISFVTVGDLDGDGVLDIVASNGELPGMTVLRGTGSGHWHAPLAILPDMNLGQLLCSDLDGTGRDDIVALRWRPRGVAVTRFAGAGTPPKVTEIITPAAISATTVRCGAHPCIVVGGLRPEPRSARTAPWIDPLENEPWTNHQSNEPRPGTLLLIRGGSGKLRVGKSIPLDFAPMAITAADLNADSRDDIIVAGWGRASVFLGK